MKIKTTFIIFAILVQPSTLWAKYIGGKEVEKISGMNLAQQNEPVRAPFFQGEGLPRPPQQNAPWPHGADALSKAAATLFEQGLADPRGLEYREIEIAIGSPWDGGGYFFRAAMMKKHIAAISAEQGIVINQAQTTLLATPQRTAESRRVAPTPMIAPVIMDMPLFTLPCGRTSPVRPDAEPGVGVG